MRAIIVVIGTIFDQYVLTGQVEERRMNKEEGFKDWKEQIVKKREDEDLEVIVKSIIQNRDFVQIVRNRSFQP